MGQNVNTPDERGVEIVDLREALEERYLSYALSTIMNRALPDVRDGLKPVHRRILYGMRQMRLSPATSHKKCAKVVGEVMGNYHPHGDQAIYDAMVRLAQDFAVRYPLVDGQGNFGNIDGDNAAAMRYTEARMTAVAELLLEGIDEDAVDFRETYDGEGSEPAVLPGAFPNLLANGAAGIAVGMATNIPPHNAAELCEAALHLIKHPNASIEKLVEMVPGPDLPTGGVIVSTPGEILHAYKTGRGAFRVRARYEIEKVKGGGYRVVVTEMPYQVQKGRLVEAIAEMLQARKLPLLGDVVDESAEDIRLVLEPRSRSVDADLMMESLFKLTDLEIRISLNMNVLSHGQVPNVIGLRQVLLEWLDHRKEVLVRRSRHRLGKIESRLEVLGGYLIAFLNIDEVIRIIREEDEPKAELMRTFELTDVQAEAVLNLRLRALRKLEEMELRREHEALTEERAQIEALLGSDERQWKVLAHEIRSVRDTFGQKTELGRRRTSFAEAPAIDVGDIQQAMVEREPITVVVSNKGWIRALRGHLADFKSLTFKSGDKLHHAFHAETTNKILVMASNGRFYTLDASKLPGGRGHGEPVRIMVDVEAGAEIVAVFKHEPGRELLLASSEGYGFRAAEDDLVATTRKGKQALTTTATSEAALCVAAKGTHVASLGENRKLLVFPLEQVPRMARGKGVRLQRFKDGGIADLRVFGAKDGLSWTDSAGRVHSRSLDELSDWKGDRAQAGRLPPQGFPRRNRFGGEGL